MIAMYLRANLAALLAAATLCVGSHAAAQVATTSTMNMEPGSGFQPEMHHSMKKMNTDMMGKPMSGDPDRDFLLMMIPHHQGAVDMAKIHLKYGKDEKLKEMSRKIIEMQEKEIAEMEQHLQKLGGETTATAEMTQGHTSHREDRQ